MYSQKKKTSERVRKADCAYYASKMADAYVNVNSVIEAKLLVKKILTNALKNPNLTKLEKSRLTLNYGPSRV